MSVRAGLFGVGAALPEHVVTNGDLTAHLDTTDDWIVRRTGIRERRRLADDASLAGLAAEACAQALADAGRSPEEVDRVRDAPVVSKPVKSFLQVSGIVCTSSPRRRMAGGEAGGEPRFVSRPAISSTAVTNHRSGASRRLGSSP